MNGGSHDPVLNARLTGYTRPGFAAQYQAYRPRPPEALVGLLLQVAQTRRPSLVVDLRSGTGVSTRLWADHAKRVVGIEPLGEMRAIAEGETAAPNVRFLAGVAERIDLPDGAADVVTCAQSLHDMEPERTLAEVARILRLGGVFAAYDYDWPPVVHWEAELAFLAFMDHVGELRSRHSMTSEMRQWDKEQHLARMRRCGHFRYARQLLLNHSEPCSAERWVGFALTISHVLPVLDLVPSESELGLEAFRRVAERTLGKGGLPWHVSYRVRLAVK
jgi:SAM-dependent methyltransferase